MKIDVKSQMSSQWNHTSSENANQLIRAALAHIIESLFMSGSSSCRATNKEWREIAKRKRIEMERDERESGRQSKPQTKEITREMGKQLHEMKKAFKVKRRAAKNNMIPATKTNCACCPLQLCRA